MGVVYKIGMCLLRGILVVIAVLAIVVDRIESFEVG